MSLTLIVILVVLALLLAVSVALRCAPTREPHPGVRRDFLAKALLAAALLAWGRSLGGVLAETRPIDPSVFDAMLKDDYLGPIREMLNSQSILLRRLGGGELAHGGKLVVIPLRIGVNSGAPVYFS